MGCTCKLPSQLTDMNVRKQVAGQVAVVHELVESLRSEWDSRTGQDPFEVISGIVVNRLVSCHNGYFCAPAGFCRSSIGFQQKRKIASGRQLISPRGARIQ